jgi:hypothetical protein
MTLILKWLPPRPSVMLHRWRPGFEPCTIVAVGGSHRHIAHPEDVMAGLMFSPVVTAYVCRIHNAELERDPDVVG